MNVTELKMDRSQARELWREANIDSLPKAEPRDSADHRPTP